jgi:hypothetical protein
MMLACSRWSQPLKTAIKQLEREHSKFTPRGSIHQWDTTGARKRYTAVGHSANSAFAGELGWAFIAGGWRRCRSR